MLVVQADGENADAGARQGGDRDRRSRLPSLQGRRQRRPARAAPPAGRHQGPDRARRGLTGEGADVSREVRSEGAYRGRHGRRPGHRLCLRPGARRGRRQGDHRRAAARSRPGGQCISRRLGHRRAFGRARRNAVLPGRRGRGDDRARLRAAPTSWSTMQAWPRATCAPRTPATPTGTSTWTSTCTACSGAAGPSAARCWRAARARSSMSARCRASSSTSRSPRRSTMRPRRRCII